LIYSTWERGKASEGEKNDIGILLGSDLHRECINKKLLWCTIVYLGMGPSPKETICINNNEVK
jgi:hypothetical protein